MMKIISITGGKGGIGKTTISVNLAVSFAKMGKRVLLFDADLGLANVDVLLGLKPKLTINDFIQGRCSLTDVCVTGPYGIKIIPSASGVQSLADLSSADAVEIIRSFSSLTENMDVMLIDMASGISRQVIDFTNASQSIVLSICNDPSSLMDSFAVIKILHQNYGRRKFGIIVNKVKNMKEGYQVYLRFQETITRFMNASIEFLGHIPQDDFVNIAARENASIVDRFGFAPAALAMQDLSKGILNWVDDAESNGGIQYFFEKMLAGRSLAKGELCEA